MKNKLAIPKPKKVKRSTLLHKADKLFSAIVRSKGKCELKGKDKVNCGGNLQTMHILGRTNRRLRWDFNNAICGCAGHHIYYTYHPYLFMLLMCEKFFDKWRYVTSHRNELLKETYEEVIKRLEAYEETN